jgi:hypothetical protein
MNVQQICTLPKHYFVTEMHRVGLDTQIKMLPTLYKVITDYVQFASKAVPRINAKKHYELI